MSISVNKVILLGNIGNDPDIKHTGDGSVMFSLSIATNEVKKDKTNDTIHEYVEWHRVQVYGKLAESVSKFMKKGGKCYVEGTIRTRKYSDKNGIERYSTEIIAKNIISLSYNGTGTNTNTDSTGQSMSSDNTPHTHNVDTDIEDDIPF